METWPSYQPKPEYHAIVKEELVKTKPYLAHRYLPYLQAYHAVGDYLNWGRWKNYRNLPGRIQLDEEGIPMIKYGDRFFYNPVTLCQYALTMYGRGMRDSKYHPFIRAAERLITLQESSGAFRYPFQFPYFRGTFEPGWVSGMAQGQALSVFSRAYHLTGKGKFLRAGNAALEFMMIPVSQGGTMATLKDIHPSLDHYIIFEEYPVAPCSYTLNGFLFTALGLYDWSQLAKKENEKRQKLADDLFQKSIRTAKQIVPYYDLGGYTSYDLRHIVYQAEPKSARTYHAIHLYLLYALHSITQDPVFRSYYKLWKSYIDS
jgi:heparosan-N-sulfate-glucuronate 5-epimerase